MRRFTFDERIICPLAPSSRSSRSSAWQASSMEWRRPPGPEKGLRRRLRGAVRGQFSGQESGKAVFSVMALAVFRFHARSPVPGLASVLPAEAQRPALAAELLRQLWLAQLSLPPTFLHGLACH